MKRVAIVSSHFPPSNLAGVHRSRLWAMHLPEFGWEPTIVTCHHRYYEEKLDYSLLEMLPKWLKVIRTPAFKTKPVKLVGDAGIRTFYWVYRALCELAEAKRIDFVVITIPSNFLAAVGMLIKRRYGIKFGIDYIDPWVHCWPGSEIPGTKHWFSRKLSEVLEPISVADADLITGINPGYFSGMLERNPAVRQKAVISSMPYGVASSDFDHALKRMRTDLVGDYRRTSEGRDKKVWVYAGAFLPKSLDVYHAFFKSLALLKRQDRLPAGGMKLFFIGTGINPTDESGFQVLRIAQLYGLESLVFEHPQRADYGQVLACLSHADGILIIGSHEKHYSPSKIYQALLSGKPIWAVLHKESTAWKSLDTQWGCEGFKLVPDKEIHISKMADSLENAFRMKGSYAAERKFLHDSEIHSVYSARKLADALDACLEVG